MGDLTNAGAAERANRMRARIEACKKLQVTPAPDGSGALIVDATAIRVHPNDPPYWTLRDEGDGVWSHWQSGEAGTLGQMLDGIVCAYLVPTVGEATDAG